jgi:hypothetical protein
MRITSIRVDYIPIDRAESWGLHRAPGPHANDGWDLAPSEFGVTAKKDGRTLLIPWAKVQLADIEQGEGEDVRGSTPRTARRPGATETAS